MAVLQLVAVVAVLVVSSRLQRRLAVRQPLLPDREVRVRLHRAGQHVLLALVCAEAALLTLPLLALLRESLSVGDGWGLDWWAALLDPPETTTSVVDVTGRSAPRSRMRWSRLSWRSWLVGWRHARWHMRVGVAAPWTPP